MHPSLVSFRERKDHVLWKYLSGFSNGYLLAWEVEGEVKSMELPQKSKSKQHQQQHRRTPQSADLRAQGKQSKTAAQDSSITLSPHSLWLKRVWWWWWKRQWCRSWHGSWVAGGDHRRYWGQRTWWTMELTWLRPPRNLLGGSNTHLSGSCPLHHWTHSSQLHSQMTSK